MALNYSREDSHDSHSSMTLVDNSLGYSMIFHKKDPNCSLENMILDSCNNEKMVYCSKCPNLDSGS